MPPQRYSRPPIVEAILDVQVEVPERIKLDDLVKCQKALRKDYPDRKSTQHIAARFSFGPIVSAATMSRPVGHAFESVDKKQVFQVKREGFTFNRLSPYSGWSAFFEEAKRLWAEYARVAKPRRINRVALRYINRFDFPDKFVELTRYFRTGPQIAPELPQTMGLFFFQVFLPLPELASTVSITQAAVNPESENASILLDIDLYRTENLPNEPGIWPLFETMRAEKNRVFEACITDAARDMIS
jgi:uncharacterized protein (TIGR04255 family)